MAIDTRRTVKEDYCRSGYGVEPQYPCGTKFGHFWDLVQFEEKETTSYRGAPVEILVGQKVRKKFHAFRVFDFRVTTHEWLWCRPNGWSFWGDHGAWVYLQKTGECPYTTVDGLLDFGNMYRAFLRRDVWIKANEPDFNGAVFLAELLETVGMINTIFKGSVKVLFQTGKKSNSLWSTLSHAALNPEELWLLWRYGLLPAMMDVEGIIKALKGPGDPDRVQDGVEHDSTITGVTETDLFSGIRPYCKWNTNISLRGGAAIDIENRFDPHRWGTSFSDIVQAGWEVIPFSFIFDWFINFGSWLQSLRTLELDVKQSYASFNVNALTSVEIEGEVTGKCEIHARLHDRIVDIEPPKTPLRDPGWRTLNREIDAISLTIAILKGLLKKR